MKKCSKCKETKESAGFGKNRSTKDGLQHHCKQCRREYQLANKDKISAYQTAYVKRRCAEEPEYRQRILDHQKANAWRYREGGRDTSKPWPTDDISYDGAHHRVRACFGQASRHKCCDCGAQAQDWSYIGGCDKELVAGVEDFRTGKVYQLHYSPNPLMYVARCKACHKEFDLAESK